MKTWKMKNAATCVLHLVKQSQEVGLGILALSELLQCRANTGQSLGETQTRGIAAIVDALHEQLTRSPCEYRDEILVLEEFVLKSDARVDGFLPVSPPLSA